ncbi:MAG: endolytic transglycosylase MltG [Oscillospiraceae bacterium]|nr:endolytic transglycosylase MltG [Oscillospiraceae bacterium]
MSSDEEKTRPLPGDEPTGVVRWVGPGNRWPQAIGSPVPAEPAREEPVPELWDGDSLPEESAAPGPEGQETAVLPAPAEEETKPLPTAGEERKKKPSPKSRTKRKRVGKRTARELRLKKRRDRRERANRQPELDPWEQERDYRPIRTRRDGRIGCLGGLMYATFILSLSIVLAVFLWMAASDVLALNKEALTAEVTLPEEIFSEQVVDVKDDDGNVTGTRTVKAADINMVANILKDNGLINYKWLFRLYSSFSHADTKLDPGTYTLSTSLDYRALVTKMRAGADSQIQTPVMFPEGFNMDQVFARLEEYGVCSKEALYEAAASAEFSYAFLEGVEPGDPYRLEGYLFPDTYYFYQGMQASSAINKFLSNMHYHVTDEMWQRTKAMNMTFREIMTVASMIEKEAANDNERALIASVIYNRLNLGMQLQFDSTVFYALRDTDITELTTEIIQATDSPYNTYLNYGLPPGPICNPGMKSINAALNPAYTQYYFFALDVESNSMRFFSRYDEFAAFVATQNYSG